MTRSQLAVAVASVATAVAVAGFWDALTLQRAAEGNPVEIRLIGLGLATHADGSVDVLTAPDCASVTGGPGGLAALRERFEREQQQRLSPGMRAGEQRRGMLPDITPPDAPQAPTPNMPEWRDGSRWRTVHTEAGYVLSVEIPDGVLDPQGGAWGYFRQVPPFDELTAPFEWVFPFPLNSGARGAVWVAEADLRSVYGIDVDRADTGGVVRLMQATNNRLRAAWRVTCRWEVSMALRARANYAFE